MSPLNRRARYGLGMLGFLADLLAPPRSLTGTVGQWVTPEERRLLQLAVPRRLDRQELQRMNIQHLAMLAAGGAYDDSLLLQQAIQRLKYRSVHALAVELGALLVRAGLLLPPREDCVLCPVPLHWSRLFARGFNQAQMLATVVSPSLQWPVVQCVRRVRPTGFQAHRKKDERRTAMSSAFVASLHYVPHTVILVDDVATTGSTMDACAGVLRQQGVKEVMGLVVALG